MSRFLSCLQHSRPCCIGYTNSRLRLEFVYPIQHGRSCCKHYVQYSTVQYSTVQYSTVQYSTVQYSTVQYSTVQYSTVQYSTVQYDRTQLILKVWNQPVQYRHTVCTIHYSKVLHRAYSIAGPCFTVWNVVHIVLWCHTYNIGVL